VDPRIELAAQVRHLRRQGIPEQRLNRIELSGQPTSRSASFFKIYLYIILTKFVFEILAQIAGLRSGETSSRA